MHSRVGLFVHALQRLQSTNVHQCSACNMHSRRLCCNSREMSKKLLSFSENYDSCLILTCTVFKEIKKLTCYVCIACNCRDCTCCTTSNLKHKCMGLGLSWSRENVKMVKISYCSSKKVLNLSIFLKHKIIKIKAVVGIAFFPQPHPTIF